MVKNTPVSKLHDDPTNPRKPDQARLGLLRLSVAKLGFCMPMYTTSDGMLLSGHQRLTVAKSLGLKKVPVIVVDLQKKDIQGINILFNRRLAVSEPVVTPDGWVPIGQIRAGDYVIGRDGQPHEVTRVGGTETRQMYRVIFDDGVSILADDEHLWSVEYTGKSQTKYIGSGIYQTGELRTMLQDNRRIGVPTIEPVDLPERSLPVDPWLLGVLLGDGSLTEYGVRLHTSAPDWVFATAKKALPSGVFGHTVRTGRDRVATMDFVGGYRGGVMNNPLLDIFRSLNLSGTTASSKFVPEEYLWASKKQRLSLLQGLMDSDGCAGAGGGTTAIYTTVSTDLADATVHLVLSLGGKAAKRVMREGNGCWSTAYQVSVRLPSGVCPFTRPDRVAAFIGTDSPRLRRRIVSIEKRRKLPAVCISINSEDHLYLARGFIPTHNCTNDFNAFDTGSNVQGKLSLDEVIAAAEALPDFDGESWIALDCKERSIADLGANLSDRYDKKATCLAESVRAMKIRIPIVVSDSGTIINGVHRLFAAKEAGEKTWPTIVVPDVMAAVALNFLNYLSMDFHVDEDFAKMMRYSAYRRPQNNRGNVPKAMRFWANGNRTLMDRDSYSTAYWQHFRELHGTTILDFGAGLCKVRPFVEARGMVCSDFEPYRIDPDSGVSVPSASYSIAKAKEFLDEIADGRVFTSIFLASVLNSVPFPKDRMVVLTIVHALSSKDTCVYGTCRDISDFNYEYGGVRNANFFVFDSEPGVRLGDVMRNPKVQKFHTQEEAEAMFVRLWGKTEYWPGGNVFYFKLSNPKGINPKVLAAAIEIEFNLPYGPSAEFPTGTAMGLSGYAKKAFGKRLGIKFP